MTDSHHTGKNASSSAAKSRKEQRDDRLGAELRANLKRRKAAARGRESTTDPVDTGESPGKR